MTTGAETLVKSLLAGGVDVCFTNPGTSEMHFVGALDKIGEMRCVLGLFEGVVTGAADGYYRIARRPAATLLHLAPGLGNGLANLHNARKARSGIVNIVGNHGRRHARYDTPLSGDVEGVARTMSSWVRTTSAPEHLSTDTAEAVRLARQSPGGIATLILPADISWGEGTSIAAALPPTPRAPVNESVIVAAADALRAAGPAGALLLGGVGVRGRALKWAGRIAARTGCRLIAETHNARVERGAGRVPVSRIPYTQPVEAAVQFLAETQTLILAGSKAPMAFFAYPEKPIHLTRPDCIIQTLAECDDDIEGALEAMATLLGIRPDAPVPKAGRIAHEIPDGALTHEGMGAVIAALLPENAIVVDEAVTSGRSFFRQSEQAAPHDWLASMGGSIGFALPAAIGAAIAAPDRKVLALTGDGSAMYTLQALWTMAREALDVTIVVFANRTYQILRGEFANMGLGEPGARAEAMLTIGDPALDWCALAKGHGVEAGRAHDLAEFASQLRRGFTTSGPYLIEVML